MIYCYLLGLTSDGLNLLEKYVTKVEYSLVKRISHYSTNLSSIYIHDKLGIPYVI